MADKWQCPTCAGVNPGSRDKCLGCDTPRLIPEASSPARNTDPDIPTPNLDKALEIWEKLDLGNLDGGSEREKALRASSYFRLAIENKEGPPGEAAERLSFIMLSVEPEKAKRFANMALSQDHNSVFARFVLFALAAVEFETTRGAEFPDLDFSGGGNFVASAVIGGIFEGFAGARKSGKKNNLRKAALAVGSAFRSTMNQKLPWKPGYFLFIGDLVLITADILRSDFGIKEISMYQTVVDAPWDQFDFLDDMREEAEDLVARAQGTLLL